MSPCPHWARAFESRTIADESRPVGDESRREAFERRSRADKTPLGAYAGRSRADKTRLSACERRSRADKTPLGAYAGRSRADKTRLGAYERRSRADKTRLSAYEGRSRADKTRLSAYERRSRADEPGGEAGADEFGSAVRASERVHRKTERREVRMVREKQGLYSLLAFVSSCELSFPTSTTTTVGVSERHWHSGPTSERAPKRTGRHVRRAAFTGDHEIRRSFLFS